MDDKRNMILAVVLSMLVLFGWQYFFAPEPPSLKDTQVSETNIPGSGTDSNRTAPAAETTPPDDVPDAQSTTPKHQDIRIPVESDDSTGAINLRGAKVDQWSLRGYRETLDPDSGNIVLLKSDDLGYDVRYGWVGEGTTLPDDNTLWSASGSTLAPDQPLTLRWVNPEGVAFAITFRLEDRYLLSIEQSVTNNASTDLHLAPYGLINRQGTPTTSGFFILHEGLIGVFDETLEEIDYDTVLEDGRIPFKAAQGWIGISDKYWLVTQIPDQSQNFSAAFSARAPGGAARYQADFIANKATNAQSTAPDPSL